MKIHRIRLAEEKYVLKQDVIPKEEVDTKLEKTAESLVPSKNKLKLGDSTVPAEIQALNPDQQRHIMTSSKKQAESLVPPKSKLRISSVESDFEARDDIFYSKEHDTIKNFSALKKANFEEENEEPAPSLKEEMVSFLQNHFGSEIDESDIEVAIYYFARDYHSGQSSELYSILSTSEYRPGPMSDLESEGDMVELCYNLLEEEFGDRV